MNLQTRTNLDLLQTHNVGRALVDARLVLPQPIVECIKDYCFENKVFLFLVDNDGKLITLMMDLDENALYMGPLLITDVNSDYWCILERSFPQVNSFVNAFRIKHCTSENQNDDGDKGLIARVIRLKYEESKWIMTNEGYRFGFAPSEPNMLSAQFLLKNNNVATLVAVCDMSYYSN